MCPIPVLETARLIMREWRRSDFDDPRALERREDGRMARLRDPGGRGLARLGVAGPRRRPSPLVIAPENAASLRVAVRLGMRKLRDDVSSGRPVVIMGIDRPALHICNTGAIRPQSS
ncbi:MAG TPA: hypothetical protein VN615_07515 [Gaiellales bacterium]|nr:hypothetical protein [Gaiellales bacterium]